MAYSTLKRDPKTLIIKPATVLHPLKFIEIADSHPELEALEILEILDCSSEHKPSVATAQRILRSKGMNHPKGRRSKQRWRKREQLFKRKKGVKRVEKKQERSNVYTNKFYLWMDDQ